jgi:ATP-dependent Lon protease
MSDTYPVLPLPGLVMFPNLMTQIHTSDPYTQGLKEEIQRFDGKFITTLLVHEGDYFYQTGCLVQMEDFQEDGRGGVVLTIRGLDKFFIEECPITHPVIYAKGKVLKDYSKDKTQANHDAVKLTRLLQRYVFLTQSEPDPILKAISFMSEPSILANFCAHHCYDDAAEKQEFLQTLNINKSVTSAIDAVDKAIQKKLKEHGDTYVY